MTAPLRLAVALDAGLAELVRAAAGRDDEVRDAPEGDWPCDVWFTGAPRGERPAGQPRVVVVTDAAGAARAPLGAVCDAVILEGGAASAIAAQLDEVRASLADPLDDLLRAQRGMVAEARGALERESAKANALPPRWAPRWDAPLEVTDVGSFLAVVRHVEREARAHWRRFSVACMDAPLPPDADAELRPFDVILRAPGAPCAVLLPDVSRADELSLERAGATVARFPSDERSAVEWLAPRLNPRRGL